MPAQASTESAKPTERLRNGSSSKRPVIAADQVARTGPPRPSRVRPTSPRPSPPPGGRWARCGRARRRPPRRQTEQVQPSTADATPACRSSRNASRRVRFAPETAVRWVNPVCGSRRPDPPANAEVSPTHQRRYQGTRLGAAVRDRADAGRTAPDRPGARLGRGGAPTPASPTDRQHTASRHPTPPLRVRPRRPPVTADDRSRPGSASHVDAAAELTSNAGARSRQV